MRIKNAEILCVGTELLIGDIVNTNAAFISQRLAALGIDQYYQAAVGDNPERLRRAILSALERCDLLIMSGGLGPTYDDLTKEVAAECMGRALHPDSEALENIKRRFAFSGRKMTPNNEKQALIPDGSTVFYNSAGTAPGCAIEDPEGGKLLIMLPGPPFELRKMFDDAVIPYLSRFTDHVLVSKSVGIFGIGESECESLLHELMLSSKNPTVAPYCGDGEVRLRVTASGKDAVICGEMCNEMIDKILRSPVGRYVYGVDVTLAEAVVQAYSKAKSTVAFAESCTGGLVSGALTAVPGASEVIGYGAVTYSNDAKIKLLGVSPRTLDIHGAVSAETAKDMARGVRALSGSSVGVSLTGYAGPGGGDERNPVGSVFVGISSERGERAVLLHLSGDRARVRTLAVTNALSETLTELRELCDAAADHRGTR